MKYLLAAAVFVCVLTFVLGLVADNRPVIYARIDSRAAVVVCGLVAVALAIAYGIGLALGWEPW